MSKLAVRQAVNKATGKRIISLWINDITSARRGHVSGASFGGDELTTWPGTLYWQTAKGRVTHAQNIPQNHK